MVFMCQTLPVWDLSKRRPVRVSSSCAMMLVALHGFVAVDFLRLQDVDTVFFLAQGEGEEFAADTILAGNRHGGRCAAVS